MSHFGDLIRGGKQTPEVAPPAPVDTTPASVEPDEEVNLKHIRALIYNYVASYRW